VIGNVASLIEDVKASASEAEGAKKSHVLAPHERPVLCGIYWD
jgi:hypothetical protein